MGRDSSILVFVLDGCPTVLLYTLVFLASADIPVSSFQNGDFLDVEAGRGGYLLLDNSCKTRSTTYINYPELKLTRLNKCLLVFNKYDTSVLYFLYTYIRIIQHCDCSPRASDEIYCVPTARERKHW